VAVAAAAALSLAPAFASTPSLVWAGAKQLAVICLVQSSTLTETVQFERELCRRVEALARRSAPIPVRQAQPGDHAVMIGDAATLLVHASVERNSQGRTVAFTIRPYRASGGETDILFGTTPRAIEIPRSGINPALDAGLSRALAEVLPWQAPAGLRTRPIS
jgi:hypothetical protein